MLHMMSAISWSMDVGPKYRPLVLLPRSAVRMRKHFFYESS